MANHEPELVKKGVNLPKQELEGVERAFKEKLDELLDDFLEFKEDWDGEGSKGVRPETINKARDILVDLNARFINEYKRAIDIPILEPDTDGGILIHWENDRFDLLLKIRENLAKPILFSGDDYKKNCIKGTIENKKLHELFVFYERIAG